MSIFENIGQEPLALWDPQGAWLKGMVFKDVRNDIEWKAEEAAPELARLPQPVTLLPGKGWPFLMVLPSRIFFFYNVNADRSRTLAHLPPGRYRLTLTLTLAVPPSSLPPGFSWLSSSDRWLGITPGPIEFEILEKR